MDVGHLLAFLLAAVPVTIRSETETPLLTCMNKNVTVPVNESTEKLSEVSLYGVTGEIATSSKVSEKEWDVFIKSDYKSRLTLNNNPVSITLQNVSEEDNGVYRTIITLKTGSSYYQHWNITVKAEQVGSIEREGNNCTCGTKGDDKSECEWIFSNGTTTKTQHHILPSCPKNVSCWRQDICTMFKEKEIIKGNNSSPETSGLHGGVIAAVVIGFVVIIVIVLGIVHRKWKSKSQEYRAPPVKVEDTPV